MAKLDIYGGLLGTGKTTLIKQMLSSAYAGYKTAIIENEVGRINLDAEEIQNASVSVKEISSGCICCTVKGSFTEAVSLLVQQENPDYIVVEPSGVAALADVADACAQSNHVALNRVIMVINAKKIQLLLKVVGSFFLEQIKSAKIIYLNFTEGMGKEQVEEIKNAIHNINLEAMIISVPLAEITAETFPEGISFDRNGTSHFQIGPFQKKGKTNVIARVRGKQKNTLNDWCYQFQGTFDEKRIQKLMDIFRQEQCSDIWRVKGYLKMQDGGIRKIDCVFGDQFLEERDSFAEDKANMLIIIGKGSNILWLEEQLEKL